MTANGHFVPIGVCLTNREDTETFEFLFKWIKESATNAPYALMSDADMASRNAAVNIFGDKLVLLMCYYHQKKAVKRKLQFVKEKDETVSTKLDLVCENGYKKNLLGTILILGLLFGSFIGGFVGDKFGRKKACSAT